MPIKYDILSDTKLVMAVGSGVVTANEILEHLYSLAEDQSYTSPMKKLIDYRNVESINISPEEAQLIAQTKTALAKKFAGERCAFVSPGDLTYGTARVHQTLVGGSDIDTQVFRSFEEAIEWLGILLKNG